MTSRREFLKRAALTTAGSALALTNIDAIGSTAAKNVNVNAMCMEPFYLWIYRGRS